MRRDRELTHLRPAATILTHEPLPSTAVQPDVPVHPGLMIPGPGVTGLGIFMLAALVLLLTPGPAVLYIVARSLDQGRRASVRRARLRRAFLDGVVVNVLTPKTALFFLAFLPQFVDVSRGRVGPQILTLGTLFVALGLITDGGYALTAGTAAQWLRSRPRFLASERWISGVMYIGLGMAAALSSSHQPRGDTLTASMPVAV
jgi:threonine/homoserine/homoserine lactone efflux protein